MFGSVARSRFGNRCLLGRDVAFDMQHTLHHKFLIVEGVMVFAPTRSNIPDRRARIMAVMPQ